MLRIEPGFGDRLRHAFKRAGTMEKVCEKIGVAVSTPYTWFSEKVAPPFDKVLAVCALGTTSLDYVISGDVHPDTPATRAVREIPAPSHVEVPIYDISVAAGDGAAAFDAAPSGSLGLDAAWLAARGLDGAELAICTLKGDSMEPELRSGDMLMFDRRQTAITESLAVVLFDDHLYVKRLQRAGPRQVTLRSSNPIYPDMVIDLKTDGDAFRVVGRAVWSGRML